MKYLINEEIDSYIREVFAWTFEHEAISAWFQAVPIGLWVIFGLFYILMNEEWENDNWKMAFGRVSVYVLTPIIYLTMTGYIGYFYYN